MSALRVRGLSLLLCAGAVIWMLAPAWTAAQQGGAVELRILRPASGARFGETQRIRFMGQGVRTEGEVSRAIEAGELRWTSSIDGNIGAGAAFDVQLSPGTHTIRLSLDSGESVSISIEVQG
jgi:hypothetical protein